jgi:hypothetical protein
MKDKDHFEKCAAHEITCAKNHRKAAGETSGAAAEFHKAMQDEHTDHAEYYIARAKSCASNADGVDDVTPSTSVRGGNNSGGPKAMESFGMRKALADEKEPVRFGMTAARERFDKVAPTRVSAIAPEQSGVRMVARSGGPPLTSISDPTSLIDELRK